MRYLVTGCAGFIGSHVCERLLAEGHHVVGVDKLHPFNCPDWLQSVRLARLQTSPRFLFRRLNIAVMDDLWGAFSVGGRFDAVVHLAAYAGVRASMTYPELYAESNLVGQTNVCEIAATFEVPRLLYASSSSVYGETYGAAACEGDATSEPLNYYAATKQAGELIARAYWNTQGLNSIGLRFFTVYGPRGRPDMAYWQFAERMLAGQPITVYGGERQERDFTYIDDVVAVIMRLLELSPAASPIPNLLNVGTGRPQPLDRLIGSLERALGVQAIRDEQPLSAAEATSTRADTEQLEDLVGFVPQVPLEVGIGNFVEWYRHSGEVPA